MNYKKIYEKIIENRKKNKFNGYTEKHHIIPNSLGGDNSKENIVELSTREHFICHYLLTKLYKKRTIEWYKMNHAFMMMKCKSLTNNERYFNSRIYEYHRQNFSEVMSYNQSGKRNSNYGTIWICNIELKKNKKIKKTKKIPIGWIKGRNKWYKKPKKVKKYKTPELIKKRKKEIEYYWNMFINGNYKSLNDFAKTDYPYSQPNLINMFRKYIPEYSDIFRQGKTYKENIGV